MGKKATAVRHKPELLRAIQSKQRDHFEELLQRLVGAEPTQAQLKEWAKERPSEYYKAMRTASQLAGYRDSPSEVTNNTLIQVHTMSDSQLEQELLRVMTPEVKSILDAKDVTPDKG